MDAETTRTDGWARRLLYIGAAMGGVLLFGTLAVWRPAGFFADQRVQVLAPARVTVGDAVPVDVYVTGRGSGRPLAGAAVQIQARADRNGAAEWQVRIATTDEAGACHFTLPSAGLERLPFLPIHVRVESPRLGTDVVHLRVPLARPAAGSTGPAEASLFIVTDKPLYQPGQTLHYAVHVLQPETLAPRPNEALSVEILDARGNRVEQRQATSSARGIAGGTFPLAADVLTGTWRLRVTAGAETAERAVSVRRYVRRRLEIETSFAPAWVSPAASTVATVRARYFGGRPAAGVRVRLLATRAQPAFAREFHAVTGADGCASLELAGLAQAVVPGAAASPPLAIEVTADDGGTPESWTGTLPLFVEDTRVELLPAGGAWLAGSENRALFAASRPDGTPAPGAYTLYLEGQAPCALAVPDTGFCELRVTVPAGPVLRGMVEWRDPSGRTRQVRLPDEPLGGHGLRILPDRASLRPRPGGTVSGEVALAPAVARDLEELRLTLGTPRGVLQQESTGRVASDTVPFRFALPATPGSRLILQAFARTRTGGVYSGRVELPVVAPAPAMALVPARAETAPGETNRLRVQLADAGGTGIPGAATVLVTDAAVLARAGGPTVEADTAAWLGARDPEPNLPGPVLAAWRDGTLPFLARRSGAADLRAHDNRAALDRRDAWRRQTWYHLLLAGVLALAGATVLYYVVRAMIRGHVLINALVVLMILVILAGMLMPALGSAREKARAFSGPPMTDAEVRQALEAVQQRGSGTGTGTGGEAEPPREFFPETLLFLPEVALDATGAATVDVPAADTITTWHASGVGVAQAGGLAAGGTAFTATKPFYVEADVPVAFIEGDRPLLRCTVFGAPGTAATVHLAAAPFLECAQPVCDVRLGAEGRAACEFPVRLVRSGRFTLELQAAGGGHTDALRLPVDVTPHGREVVRSTAGLLAAGESASAELGLPADAALRRYALRAYPSPLAEYLGGLEALLREPSGCFEQTTSVNYPNVMIVKYLRGSGRTDAALEERARGLLRAGYQRLLTFEVKDGGGFSLYGQAPARLWLSALGLMQLRDMADVLPVDPAVGARTWAFVREHLAGAETPERAFAVWAALRCGYRDEAVQAQVAKLDAAAGDPRDPYTQALALNACLELDPQRTPWREAAGALARQVLAGAGRDAAGRTLSSAHGYGAEAETLALVTLALQRAGMGADLEGQLLKRLAQLRSPQGAWPGTQATTLALRALSAGGTARGGVRGELVVESGGIALGRLPLTGDEREPPLLELAAPATDSVTVRFAGEGAVRYALVASGHRRWGADEADTARAGLNLRVGLPTGATAAGRALSLRVELQERSDGAENILVDLGLGPALAPDAAGLDALVGAGRVRRWEARGDRLVLYLGGLKAGEPLTLTVPLVAARPGTWRLPVARAYEYYRPENLAVVPGPELTVQP